MENGDLEVVFVDREWEKNGEVKECEVGRVHHLAVILIYIYIYISHLISWLINKFYFLKNIVGFFFYLYCEGEVLQRLIEVDF